MYGTCIPQIPNAETKPKKEIQFDDRQSVRRPPQATPHSRSRCCLERSSTVGTLWYGVQYRVQSTEYKPAPQLSKRKRGTANTMLGKGNHPLGFFHSHRSPCGNWEKWQERERWSSRMGKGMMVSE